MKKFVLIFVAILMVGCMNDCFAQTFVDLGLSSGTKWSTSNVKVFHKFEDANDLFGYKMPSKAQWRELISECEWTWVKGKNAGYRVTGPNGRSIFLPAAGYRDCYGDVHDVGEGGGYWSGTEYKHYTLFNDYEGGYLLQFDSSEVEVVWGEYCKGRSVRLVQN